MNNLVWNIRTGSKEEVPEKVQQFISEIIAVSKKYGLTISHEDYEGGFIIEDYDESNIDWLKAFHMDCAQQRNVGTKGR